MQQLWKNKNIIYRFCLMINNNKPFYKSDSLLYLRTVFHLLGFLHHLCVSILADSLSKEIAKHPNPDVTALYRFRTAFITSWNFIFQTVFLGLSLFYDVLEWLDKHESTLASRIKYFRDVIFCSMVVPITIFVSSTFWLVYVIDRELVLPKIYDEVVPWWLNQCAHTNITIMIVIETILQARRHPTNRKLELILYWVFAFAYTIVYYAVFFFTNKWLYPVSETITWWQASFYTTLILGVFYVFYELQFPINRLLHKEENDDTEDKEDTKEETEENFSKSWTRVGMKFRHINMNQNSRSSENFANSNYFNFKQNRP